MYVVVASPPATWFPPDASAPRHKEEAAPTVFRFNGEASLEFDYAPDDALREKVERAVAACPVQAIRIGLPDAPPAGEPPVTARGEA